MSARSLLVCVMLACAAFAPAQDPDPDSRPDSRSDSRESAADDAPATRRRGRRRPESRPDPGLESRPAESPFLAIVNGTVYPVSGPVIRQGTVLIRDGKIVDVGRLVRIPDGARILDARDKHVAPGFVAVRAFGTFGTSFPARGEEKQSDQVNPFAQSMLMALASGITTACEGGSPTATGAVGGFIGKHTYGSLEGCDLREPAAVFLQYSGGDMSARLQTREAFEKAAQHRRDLRAFFADALAGKPGLKAPTADANVKNLVRVMDGELSLIVSAATALDLNGVAELATEFDVPMVIQGAREAWTMTGALARAPVSIIVNPRQRTPEGNQPTAFYEDPSGWSIENAAKIDAAGIPWCVQSLAGAVGTGGLPGRDLMQLNMDAAFTMRGGVSEAAALRAVTLGAAELLKIADRVGSLDRGKDADVVIFDLAPLDYKSFAEVVLVNGKTVYEKDKVSFFDHIQTDRSKGLKGRWWNER